MTSPDAAGTWVVELAGVDASGRDEFLEWLWAMLGDRGLVGIAEGEVSVGEAAEAGLVESPLVIDAAAAPRDRDWVAALPPGSLRCWFASEAAAREAVVWLRSQPGCEVRSLAELPAEPVDAWRETFAAIEVPGFGVVRPAWEEGQAVASQEGRTIFIEPGVGFGTALHPTTQFCLTAVAAGFDAGETTPRVLDFGSGSGVLGIAAAVLGAGRVDAVEIDEAVHAAIGQNAARNDVAAQIQVHAHLPDPGPGYDLVVANIVAEVLLAHAAVLCGSLRREPAERPTGRLVLSGLRAEDLPAVAAAFTQRLGAEPVATDREGWYCLVWSMAENHAAQAARRRG